MIARGGAKLLSRLGQKKEKETLFWAGERFGIMKLNLQKHSIRLNWQI
jgi:hypothetical protein